MNRGRVLLRGLALCAVVAAAFLPAAATSLIRADLPLLVAENAMIVRGEVVSVESYWNEEGTFILSDVRVAVDETFKGPRQREVVITVMGGTVGDLSTVIVAGPEIEVGKRYLLMLNREDLPGRHSVMTVRDLSQGIFDVVDGPEGDWAINQAVHHELLPDKSGSVEPAGGFSGISLENLGRTIRQLAGSR